GSAACTVCSEKQMQKNGIKNIRFGHTVKKGIFFLSRINSTPRSKFFEANMRTLCSSLTFSPFELHYSAQKRQNHTIPNSIGRIPNWKFFNKKSPFSGLSSEPLLQHPFQHGTEVCLFHIF
ncbi:MAG: hypothetical protein IJY76_02445, partial [Anaerotignum sp.]|nr:hypothetical protein [Anaerotignum sp.]